MEVLLFAGVFLIIGGFVVMGASLAFGLLVWLIALPIAVIQLLRGKP